MDMHRYEVAAAHKFSAPSHWAEPISSCAAPMAAKRAFAAKPAPLERLPDELKLLILEQTGPNPFVLARMQLVSRNWRRLAQDDRLWEPLYPHAFANVQAGAPTSQPGLKSPQMRLASHLQGINHLRRLFFHELWSGSLKPATLVAGRSDAIFACHAFLALGPSWAARRNWAAQSRARTVALMHDTIWIHMVFAGAMT